MLLDVGEAELIGYGGQQTVPPGQGVAHGKVRDAFSKTGRAALEEDTSIADVTGVPRVPSRSGGREVVEGEAGGGGEGARGGGVGVGRLGGLEARGDLDDTEEERRVEGTVPAEEGGVGDEAAEGGARGGGADEVGRGGDPEKDLLQEVVGEGGGGQAPRRRRGLEAAEYRHRRHHLPAGPPRPFPATRGRWDVGLAGQRAGVWKGKRGGQRSKSW